MGVFRQALTDRGYTIGRDLVLEERYANGESQVAEFATEITRLLPEVIVVPSATVARAVHAATPTIPIVSVGQEDLREKGLVDNLGRPNSNVTGMSTPSLHGKLLQLLQEAIPNLSRVTALVDTALIGDLHAQYEAAARSLGLEIQIVGVGTPDDLERAFSSPMLVGADGIVLSGGPFIQQAAEGQIPDLALQHRLPSGWTRAEPVRRGGLLGYGANRADLFRRAATSVDKILKGARPGDLPIEQPSLYDLIINLKTAQALGVTIPPSVAAQATELIQ